jgi:hypothetical protein
MSVCFILECLARERTGCICFTVLHISQLISRTEYYVFWWTYYKVFYSDRFIKQYFILVDFLYFILFRCVQSTVFFAGVFASVGNTPYSDLVDLQ